jgi:hypothetical protein
MLTLYWHRGLFRRRLNQQLEEIYKPPYWWSEFPKGQAKAGTSEWSMALKDLESLRRSHGKWGGKLVWKVWVFVATQFAVGRIHGGQLLRPWVRTCSALWLSSRSRLSKFCSRLLSSSKRESSWASCFGVGSSKGFVSSEWLEAKGFWIGSPWMKEKWITVGGSYIEDALMTWNPLFGCNAPIELLLVSS